MPQQIEIDLAKEDMKFSSAHFCCYPGHRERLHGHNYRLAVRLCGTEMGDDGYLVDFGRVKSAAREICRGLDEYMLVPLRNPSHSVNAEAGGQVEVRCEDGSFFSFPATDCLLLPLAHITVEELARYIWEQLATKIQFNAMGINWVEIRITETPGQSATFGNRPKL